MLKPRKAHGALRGLTFGLGSVVCGMVPGKAFDPFPLVARSKRASIVCSERKIVKTLSYDIMTLGIPKRLRVTKI